MKALTQTLLAIATAGLAILSTQAAGAAADHDGDGKSDILWRNAATGENYAFFMDGRAIRYEGFLRHVSDLSWKIVGVGDFNGDGRSDILWRNSSTGANYVWLMNGAAIVGEANLRTVADQNWQVAGTGDFNGNGKDDVLWRNRSTGENYVYLMDGLSIAGEGYLRTVADQNWQVAGVGDFNGDAKTDILWRNSSTGESYVYLMQGATILGEGYSRTVSLAWQVVGVGDFNGDGKADILWRNVSTGENYLYPMNGLTILGGEGYVRAVIDLAWKIAATGDYDGDGKSDILWRNVSTGDIYLCPMDGTTIKPTEGYIGTVADLAWRPTPVAPDTTARLAWDAVTAANLGGYRIYYGNSPGVYFQAPGTGFNVGNVTTYTIVGLGRGKRYYFAVRAYDTSGNKSASSNEEFKDVP